MNLVTDYSLCCIIISYHYVIEFFEYCLNKIWLSLEYCQNIILVDIWIAWL